MSASSIPPSDTGRNDRPVCFGSGRDPESHYRTPLDACRRCAHVESCALLRLVRYVEHTPVIDVDDDDVNDDTNSAFRQVCESDLPREFRLTALTVAHLAGPACEYDPARPIAFTLARLAAMTSGSVRTERRNLAALCDVGVLVPLPPIGGRLRYVFVERVLAERFRRPQPYRTGATR